MTRQCPDCSSWFEQVSGQRRRCHLCAAIRAQRQQREWQRTHTRGEAPESTALIEAKLAFWEAHVKRTRPFSLDPYAQKWQPEVIR